MTNMRLSVTMYVTRLRNLLLKGVFNNGNGYVYIYRHFKPDKKLLYNQQYNQLQDLAHAVSIIEPRESPGIDSTQVDTSPLLSLVSYVINVSTEGPITIVSK